MTYAEKKARPLRPAREREHAAQRTRSYNPGALLFLLLLATSMTAIASGIARPFRTRDDGVLAAVLLCLGYCLFMGLLLGIVF